MQKKDQGFKPEIKPQELSTTEGNKGEEHILSPFEPYKINFGSPSKILPLQVLLVVGTPLTPTTPPLPPPPPPPQFQMANPLLS